jgi:predicted transcriptional regulator
VEDSIGEHILSGMKISNRLIYTLSAQSLYHTATNTFFHKIATFHDVHTMVAIGEKELVIAGNQGLYLYNTESGTTSVLIPGVEFNKHALFTDGQKLYAGSVSGLYTIDLKQVPKLIQRNKGKIAVKNYSYYIIAGMALLLFSVFGGVIIRLNRKLKKAEQIIQETHAEQLPIEEKVIDKEKIIDFIRMNLSTASLKSINEHFGSNTNQVYALFEPEKPGTIIQQLRTELVIAMKKEKATLSEIAAATGFSQSYIKKIKAGDIPVQ